MQQQLRRQVRCFCLSADATRWMPPAIPHSGTFHSRCVSRGSAAGMMHQQPYPLHPRAGTGVRPVSMQPYSRPGAAAAAAHGSLEHHNAHTAADGPGWSPVSGAVVPSSLSGPMQDPRALTASSPLLTRSYAPGVYHMAPQGSQPGSALERLQRQGGQQGLLRPQGGQPGLMQHQQTQQGLLQQQGSQAGLLRQQQTQQGLLQQQAGQAGLLQQQAGQVGLLQHQQTRPGLLQQRHHQHQHHHQHYQQQQVPMLAQVDSTPGMAAAAAACAGVSAACAAGVTSAAALQMGHMLPMPGVQALMPLAGSPAGGYSLAQQQQQQQVSAGALLMGQGMQPIAPMACPWMPGPGASPQGYEVSQVRDTRCHR